MPSLLCLGRSIALFGIERSIALLGMERDIEKYLNYLIANQDLFQQTTSTICGMVAIAQVELNREQQEREC
ncbi:MULTISPECIES: hypothetical protein [unclassified Microcoleus]|uniref:hypothetical protein n=1 Tax=unclassified Microcoleus TaxID=2642155 RepID=UPI002FCFC20D